VFSNNIMGVENRTVDKVHDVIRNFVASGEIKKERIDDPLKRIMKLKKRISPDWEFKFEDAKPKLAKLNAEGTTALQKATKKSFN